MPVAPGRLADNCSVSTPTPVPCHKAHLGLPSSPIHSQRDRESTANDVDLEKGAEEVAAAQSNHLLWRDGRIGWQGEGLRCSLSAV